MAKPTSQSTTSGFLDHTDSVPDQTGNIFVAHIVLIEIVRHINDSQMTSQLIGEKEDPEDGYE